MTLYLILGLLTSVFVLASAYNYDGDVIISFTRGLLFGLIWDNEQEGETKFYTLQVALGFVLLTLTYERDAKN